MIYTRYNNRSGDMFYYLYSSIFEPSKGDAMNTKDYIQREDKFDAEHDLIVGQYGRDWIDTP